MDTTKNNREEAPRRPQREVSQKPRNQSSETRRGQRPEETAQAAPRRPRPEGGQRAAAQPEGDSSRTKAPRQRVEASRQKPEAPRQRQQAPEEPRQKKQAQRPAGEKSQAKAPAKSQKPASRQAKAPQRKASRRPEKADDLSSKKRAYGNSKPKKKSTLVRMGEAVAATAQENAARRRARQEAQGKRSKRGSQQPAPAVIYTQPQAFNRDRLLVQLITVTAVVVAFVVGLSVFFKVEDIRVSGAEVYTPYSIEEASGIKKGANLLTFSRARAGALIKANLPYVKNVSFGIKLPSTVNIIIEEEDVVYSIKDQDEQWWLINSDGFVVDQSRKGQAGNYTQILGVTLDHPLRDQIAVATEVQLAAPDPTAETQEEIVIGPTVSGAQRLETALEIVKALEANDIVGSAASINVSQIQSITLWYGSRYQVNLGDTANMEYKIACMNSVILTMQDYQSGILDISFTIWPDQVGYTPFT